MIRVALRGLAARRLRTCLTALAIVLGVAMIRTPARLAVRGRLVRSAPIA